MTIRTAPRVAPERLVEEADSVPARTPIFQPGE
jgi:hypothetical protein